MHGDDPWGGPFHNVKDRAAAKGKRLRLDGVPDDGLLGIVQLDGVGDEGHQFTAQQPTRAVGVK